MGCGRWYGKDGGSGLEVGFRLGILGEFWCRGFWQGTVTGVFDGKVGWVKMGLLCGFLGMLGLKWKVCDGSGQRVGFDREW
ncbi:hypothetical protein MRB53_014726 [Persea americana]|uniref:Uncharacterized protein n=1 Tax=Persea americana TaxID=3435 RepID=A0ACC2KBN9_PERAE|nr:hypothetical protein MRB53_014726 [Persea americana]